MNQKTKDIQKRYDGFLQTAALWKNAMKREYAFTLKKNL